MINDLLHHTADLASKYLDGLDSRPVGASGETPTFEAIPEDPIDPKKVIDELVEVAEPGLVASCGPRYFGFVTGGAEPAALAADWLVSTWDQNAVFHVSSPAAAALEQTAAAWVLDLLDLPAQSSVAFVTGCQMAHVTALAAARHRVLASVGWSVSEQGLFGAPPIAVVVGEHRHSTVDRALRLLGFGNDALVPVAGDQMGRMVVGDLHDVLGSLTGPKIVVAQSGEVNTGSFDAIDEIADVVAGTDAWLHVDGAFGMWARATNRFASLTKGTERADSWAFDAHKWLNVPYDSGLAVVADREAHAAAMSYGGAYLVPTEQRRDAMDWTPEASRRARGIPVYAAIRSMGRNGISDLVERCCDLALRFARGLVDVPGAQLIAEPVINQVLFRFDDDDRTTQVLARLQDGGVAWMGPTRWDGRAAIRVSVSNWMTTEADIDLTLEAFRSAAAAR